MENFKGSLNWRIRHMNDGNGFFLEGDLPNAEQNKHYPRIEVGMEDFGDHNGYTREMRLADLTLQQNSLEALNILQECIDTFSVNDSVDRELKTKIQEFIKKTII